MPLIRPTRLITAPRARLQIVTRPTTTTLQQRAGLSSTTACRAGDHAHEDHYDPPTGWLFGVKPGEKYEPEGWENVWVYGFFGSMLFGVVGYCYKPDTRYEYPNATCSRQTCARERGLMQSTAYRPGH